MTVPPHSVIGTNQERHRSQFTMQLGTPSCQYVIDDRTDRTNQERTMTPLDSVDPLMAFAVAWEPYGGASAADVFVEFGLHMVEYRRRLAEQLRSPSTEHLEPALRERLLNYSTRPPVRSRRIGE
jgi:hypothetical protein